MSFSPFVFDKCFSALTVAMNIFHSMLMFIKDFLSLNQQLILLFKGSFLFFSKMKVYNIFIKMFLIHASIFNEGMNMTCYI